MVDRLPGVGVGYSSMNDDRGPVMEVITRILQSIISTVGFYSSLTPFIPEHIFDILEQLRFYQFICLIISIILSSFFSWGDNQVSLYFLKASLVSLLFDINFWRLTTITYTEERFWNWKLITNTFYTFFLILTIYKLKTINFTAEDNTDRDKGQNDAKKLSPNNTKKKKEQRKLNKVESNENVVEIVSKSPEPQQQTSTKKKNNNRAKKSKKVETFSIHCEYRCVGVINSQGYVSVNCRICFNQFHVQCWTRFLADQRVDHESSLLGRKCLTLECEANISEIVWVDKHGRETERKYVYYDQ